MSKIANLSLLLLICILALSCSEANKQNSDISRLSFVFEHYVEDEELQFDKMMYTSEAGNQYEVTEIQYFVSDITLNKDAGDQVMLTDDKFAHYIDTNIPETSTWHVNQEVPAGDYKSITMTFGIKGEKNEPFMFTDPPESDMLWPMNLGGDQGGYHYMKLNGFWKNQAGERTPFNFHLGVGQERDAENNITGFVQNWFEIELPASSFSVSGGDHKLIAIRMDVNEWCKSPNIYDHDIHGGKIMQNQEAMRMGVENGKSVFRVSNISDMTDAM